MEHKPKVFLDSSVIIAGLLSSRGGSFYILTTLSQYFYFQINEYVLEEVREIIKTKFSDRQNMQTLLYLWLGVCPIVVSENPTEKKVKEISKFISINDAPILASALKHSDYLLTLDNEFFGEKILSLANKKSLQILKPKELIETLKTK